MYSFRTRTERDVTGKVSAAARNVEGRVPVRRPMRNAGQVVGAVHLYVKTRHFSSIYRTARGYDKTKLYPFQAWHKCRGIRCGTNWR